MASLSQNAIYLLKQRYCAPGEEPEDVFKRVAEFLAQGDTKFEEKLFNLMINGIFLPNSPCLFSAGRNGVTRPNLHACYVLGIEDDLTSIFNTIATVGRIFKSGGGVGINFSPLRERGASLSGGGESSGVISFMSLFDNVVDVVKQGGFRRGALMGILDYCHPEILDFIKVKLVGKLQNFNLSVMVTDDFMRKVEEDKEIEIISPKYGRVATMKARNIFDLLAFSAWTCGDPALLFYDRINRDNPLFDKGIEIRATNPCGEVPLPQNAACCLGSINISKFVWKNNFNFERFAETCVFAMKVLRQMNLLSDYPMDEIKSTMLDLNPVGLGLMGFADCLIKLGIYYDSDECLSFIDSLGKIYKEATESFEKDTFFFYRRIIAPTGSLSILADCSSGIEPIFDVVFERNLTIGKIEETRDLYKSKYVRTAMQIAPEWHVKVQAKIQEYVDGAVSKTVNMPFVSSVDDVKKVFMMAWKLGCKGITIYRDGSKEQQVLYAKRNPSVIYGKCSDGECHL